MISTHSGSQGFTLVEIMVVTAILAILAAIAIPAYQNYVRSANATECANEMELIKLSEEEFFVENNTYYQGIGIAALQANSNGLYRPTFTTPAQIAQANCTFRVDPPAAAPLTAGYVLTATGQRALDASDTMIFRK